MALVIFNTLVIIFAMKYIRMFDCIITNAKELKKVDFGNEKVPFELKILNENLANSSKQLNDAIATAVRDEQLKTELITNVSHDIKTPLTSIINYVDLLKKEELSEKAMEDPCMPGNPRDVQLTDFVELYNEAMNR